MVFQGWLWRSEYQQVCPRESRSDGVCAERIALRDKGVVVTAKAVRDVLFNTEQGQQACADGVDTQLAVLPISLGAAITRAGTIPAREVIYQISRLASGLNRRSNLLAGLQVIQ